MAHLDHDAWQAEADLLADGRALLEQLCSSTRYAHLYPGGPNLALLLEAYRELDRIRTVNRQYKPRRRRDARRFRRILKRALRADALARTRRLNFHHPAPRRHPLKQRLPELVRGALAHVDDDAQKYVRRVITGHPRAPDPSASMTHGSIIGRTGNPALDRRQARLDRGLAQFREALLNAAFAQPSEIPTLHPQYISFAASVAPSRKQHPFVTLFLVRLPLQFLLLLGILFNIAYLGAYFFFNDERLGEFITDRLEPFTDGKLEIDSLHWGPTMIVDLLLGRPHPVRARGLRVYEAYKTTGGDGPERLALSVEGIDARLVLHEIIPWNRVGVPNLVEIPWVLHFTEANSVGVVDGNIRRYLPDEHDYEVVNLVQAFAPVIVRPHPELKPLSFRVDEAQFPDMKLGLDFESQGWSSDLVFPSLQFALSFNAPDPKQPTPDRIPFRYRLHTEGASGELRLLNAAIELSDFESLDLVSGVDGLPVGDVKMSAVGNMQGAQAHLTAVIRDVFGVDPGVRLKMNARDAAPLANSFFPQREAGARPMLSGANVRAQMQIEGPLDDPEMRFSAEGLTLDLFEDEPAWALDDVDAAVRLARDPVPELWDDVLDVDLDDRRWLVYIESFRGAGLDGELHRRGRGKVDHIVLPEQDDEALVGTLDFDLDGVNPGQLVPDDPELARTLRGTADGRAHLRRFVLGETLEYLEVDFPGVRVTRDLGPEDDGIPRSLRVEGGLRYRPLMGAEFDGLVVSTGGTRIMLEGGLDSSLSRWRQTTLQVEIDDGAAFADAFGLDPYFATLDARLPLDGPLFAPSGRGGSLSIGGSKSSPLPIDSLQNAKLSIDKGTLQLRGSNFAALGGKGELALDLGLAKGRELRSDPLVKANVSLSGIDRERILDSDLSVRGGSLTIDVDDGEGRPVPLSQWTARGTATAERVDIYQVRYALPEARFSLDAGKVDFEALRLDYHRSVSPALTPGATIPTGRIEVTGELGFDSDPALDLQVDVAGLPLSTITRIVDDEAPVQGTLAAGTSLRFRGTASRPAVDGTLALANLSAAGIPLGGGELTFSSNDIPANRALDLDAHREVRIEGALQNTRPGAGGTDRLSWDLRGLIAFGEKPRPKRGRRASQSSGAAPTQMELDVQFRHLPFDKLLTHPDRKAWRPHVVGQLDDLRISVEYCPEGPDFLGVCQQARVVGRERDALEVELSLEDMWMLAADDAPGIGAVGQKSSRARRTAACKRESSLCSTNRLAARLHGSMVELSGPWRLRSGGTKGADLDIAGSFDLGEVTVAQSEVCRLDDPSAPDRKLEGKGLAQIRGGLELGALDGLLTPMGVRSPKGKLDLDLNVRGLIAAPRLDGKIELPASARSIELDIVDDEAGGPPLELVLSNLDLELDRGVVNMQGLALVNDGPLHFGEHRGKSSYLSVAGPCAGRFALAGYGQLDGALPRTLFPDIIEASGGRAGLEHVYVAGDYTRSGEAYPDPLDMFTSLEGSLEFYGQDPLALDTSFERFVIQDGVIDFRLCDDGRPCGGSSSRLGVFLGGERGAAAPAPPRYALSMIIGARAGRARNDGSANSGRLWGELDLSSSVDGINWALLRADVTRVPFGIEDNAGRPEIESSLTSSNLVFEAVETGFMRLSGDVVAERSRWLRDAQQGAAVLSFEDPNPETSEPLPEVVAGIELDLSLQTSAPARSDINVLENLEARAAFTVSGTVGNPEITGVLDIERGVLDIDILGAPFDIERGRVILGSEISESEVDLTAVRQEPVKINDQIEYITLRLRGPLDQIGWECSAAGDVSGALSTARGCVDYLIFDAGNVLAVSDNVRRAGGNGLLDQGGGVVALVGNLTQFEFNDLLEDELPRLEEYLPTIRFRPGQLGAEMQVESRPEWLNWGWGRVGFGYGYLRGYPSSYLRDAQEARLRVEFLENTAIEASIGIRNYQNRALILDPPRYGAVELLHRLQVPSAR